MKKLPIGGFMGRKLNSICYSNLNYQADIKHVLDPNHIDVFFPEFARHATGAVGLHPSRER